VVVHLPRVVRLAIENQTTVDLQNRRLLNRLDRHLQVVPSIPRGRVAPAGRPSNGLQNRPLTARGVQHLAVGHHLRVDQVVRAGPLSEGLQKLVRLDQVVLRPPVVPEAATDRRRAGARLMRERVVLIVLLDHRGLHVMNVRPLIGRVVRAFTSQAFHLKLPATS